MINGLTEATTYEPLARDLIYHVDNVGAVSTLTIFYIYKNDVKIAKWYCNWIHGAAITYD